MTTNLKTLLLASVVMVTMSAPAFAQDTAGADAAGSAATTTTGDTGAGAETRHVDTHGDKPQPYGDKLNAGEETQRDVNQQDRIENGLKSGDLNTKEAAKLEQGEQRIDHVEAKDMKDGTLSPEEKARLQRMQNQESRDIYQEKHDAQTGNPNSDSSKRMQEDVQRNINQEQRVHNGVDNGTLTNREAGKLEKGQARTDREEARAGRNGRVNGREQGRLQRRDNKQSGRVFDKKHNDRQRGGRRHRNENK